MGAKTSIEWADSTLNLQMGCDGCELWNPKTGVKRCYAGTLTDRYGGRKGYPKSFAEPALFLDRLDVALKWPDLTGKDRPDKPWLSGLPRMVFLDDMGDTFTESLPLNWLAPLLPRMADSSHVWMLLTKRGSRMQQFSKTHPFPDNVWPGVSVTTQATVKRLENLFDVRGGGVRWVSAEPLWEPVELVQRFKDGGSRSFLDGQFYGMHCKGVDGNPDFTVNTIEPKLPRLGLVIVGGESGHGARPCDLAWIRLIVNQCDAADVPCFVKQLGSVPFDDNAARMAGTNRYDSDDPQSAGLRWRLRLKDKKGGDMEEWPEDLRVRQFPNEQLAERVAAQSELLSRKAEKNQ